MGAHIIATSLAVSDLQGVEYCTLIPNGSEKANTYIFHVYKMNAELKIFQQLRYTVYPTMGSFAQREEYREGVS